MVKHFRDRIIREKGQFLDSLTTWDVLPLPGPPGHLLLLNKIKGLKILFEEILFLQWEVGRQGPCLLITRFHTG